MPLGPPDIDVDFSDAIVARYRKVREHARSGDGGEKTTAKALLKKMEAQHAGIRTKVRFLDHQDAVARANAAVAQAAASRAAAMHREVDEAGAPRPPSPSSQVAYWTGFIEETIAYIAEHPNEPAPSAVAFVETLELGPPGSLFTSIKKAGARALAKWADSQVADRVDDIRVMLNARAVTPRPRPRARASSQSRAKPKSKSSPSKKRKKKMSEVLLEQIDEECDCAISESEDTETKEALYEIELVIPQSLWPKIKESPEALVAYLVGAIEGDEEEDVVEEDEEPSDSGLGLDPNDPFPNDDDDEPTPDEDEDSDQ